MPSGRKERTLTGKTFVQALNTSNKDYHFIYSFKVQINPNTLGLWLIIMLGIFTS